MNLNTKTNKVAIITVPIVLITLFTLTFLVMEKTPILITAYVVAILSSILFFVGNLYFIGVKSGYPWVAAIPLTMWRYIVTATLLSGVFVIGERFVPIFKIPYLVLIIGQIIIFVFFFVMLTLMHTGKEYISEVDKKAYEKRQFIKGLSVDLASIIESVPDASKQDIQTVIDAVRYCDPMSSEAVAAIESDILDNVKYLGQQTDTQQISTLCVTLLKQIKDRENRVRAMK